MWLNVAGLPLPIHTLSEKLLKIVSKTIREDYFHDSCLPYMEVRVIVSGKIHFDKNFSSPILSILTNPLAVLVLSSNGAFLLEK